MEPTGPIRVLVVDDSAFMRTALRRMLDSDDFIEVVGAACDGTEALEKIAKLQPDVVTLDFEMPRMNGIDVLRHVMQNDPRPVIMVSSLTQEGADATFEALEAGAFDYIPKQLSYVSLDIVQIKSELISKVHAAARAPRRKRIAAAPQTIFYEPTTIVTPKVICLGISTGGPKALQEILPKLSPSLAAPVAIVQHMPVGFTGPFARRLNGLSKVAVSEATNEEMLEPGHVYIAPAGKQLTIYQGRYAKPTARLAATPTNTPHMPSVDVMMLSAAESFGDHAMGVIMTGMGNDGERGMRAIFRAGGYTIGQDEATCTVYGMPRSCAEASLLRRVLPLDLIPHEIEVAASAHRSSATFAGSAARGMTRSVIS